MTRDRTRGISLVGVSGGLSGLLHHTGDRNRVVDLMRVVALSCVVIGHWLMQGVFIEQGTPHRQGILGLAQWTHPLTWVLQVMPIFFLVGGYVNALSWRRASQRGMSYGTWLLTRVERLTRPLIPLLVFWAVVAPAILISGLDQDWLRIAARASLVPTWFLAVYIPIIALVPVTLFLWDRYGLATVAIGIALAALVDTMSMGAGLEVATGLNVLFVWATMHQVGYAWLDRAVSSARACLLAVASFAAVVVAVAVGPYGVSMVGVTGFGVDNTSPPRVTLLLLGLWQAMTALALEAPLSRLMRRPRVWWAVAVVGSRAMTIYLWHMVALGILLGLAMWSGRGLHERPDTVQWWVTRPVWILMLVGTTAVLVSIFGHFERPGVLASAGERSWVGVARITLISAVIAALAHYSLVLPDGEVLWYAPTLAVVLLAARGPRSLRAVTGGRARQARAPSTVDGGHIRRMP